MATSAYFQWDPHPNKVTLSGSNLATWTDDISGYVFNEPSPGSNNGGVWGARSVNGWPGVAFDGGNDYVFETTTAGNLGGGNNPLFWVVAAAIFGSAGTSGDALWGMGASGSPDPFVRATEGTTGSWTFTRRSISTGGGVGISSVGSIPVGIPLIIEYLHNGTQCDITYWHESLGPTSVNGLTASNAGDLGTLNRLALGNLVRNTPGTVFGQWTVGYFAGFTGNPTTSQLDQTRTFMARFVKPSLQPLMMRGREEHLPAIGKPLISRAFFGLPKALPRRYAENALGL